LALAGVALLASALFALGILAPPSHVGGPGTSSQIGSLRTEGNLHVDRNASISGSLDVTGPTTLSSLAASGNALLNSVKLTGALGSESTLTGTQFISTVGNGHAPFIVNSSTLVNNLHASNADQLGGADPGFYVNTGGGSQAKSGGLTVGSLVTGPLTASGVTNLGGPLSVSGLTTLNGNLSVPGSATLATAVVTGNANVGGNSVVGGNLTVSGATTLALLNVINLAVTNGISVGGPLTVGGNTALKGSLNVAGPTTLANGLHVTGNTTSTGVITAGGGLVANAGGLTVGAGGANITGNTTITGNTNIGGNLAVGGNGSFSNLLTSGAINAGTTVTAGTGLTVNSGGANINGNSSVTGTLSTSGLLSANGGAAVAGGASVVGGLLADTGVFGGGVLTPGNALTVNGNGNVTGTFTAGNLVTGGTGTFTGLVVNGTSMLNGATNVTAGGLTVVGGLISDTGVIGGGAAAAGNVLTVNGKATVSSDLAVGGNLTVAGSGTFTALAVSGPTSLGGGVTSPVGRFNNLRGTGPGTDLTLNPGGNLVLSPAGNLVIPNTVGNLTLSAAGDLKTLGSLTATANIQGVQLISTATGATPPLVVSSTTLVPNLHVATAETAVSAGTATTATTATNALNLGGLPPSAYIDTSGTPQAKAGALTLAGLTSSSATVNGVLHVTTAPLSTIDNGLQVGTLHDVGALVVDGASQFTGTVAIAGAPIGTYKLTVNGSTILTGDVAGGNQFRGLTTACTLNSATSVESCPYQGGVTLGATPQSIIVTPAGDYAPAVRYWIPALLKPTTTGFSVQFNVNPLLVAVPTPIQFYYVVVQ
jgi:fibronectin-binding autotransporter adhesin